MNRRQLLAASLAPLLLRAAKRDALSSESVRPARTRTEDCSVHCTMKLARVAIVTLLLNGAAFAQTPGMGETRRKFYRALSNAGLGREAIVIARKPKRG